RAVILSDRLEGEARDVARAHALAVRHLRAGGGLGELPRIMSMDLRDMAPRGSPSGSLDEGSPWEGEPVPGGAPIDAPHDALHGAPLVLLSGGETTVTVRGSGRG